MTNVFAYENDDSASIQFDPFEGATDYRVYPLPDDKDITVDASGHVVVKNAIYRCAGYRETADVNVENQQIPSGYVRTQVDGNTVGGYKRSLADATLGYVYATPGPGRIPVYALGDSFHLMDNEFYQMRWQASRVKTYTASETERAALLAKHFRDDGIAFYVPQTADSTTKVVYTDAVGRTGGDWTPNEMYSGIFQARYYFPDGPEAAAHPSKQAAFNVLAAAASGTQPLMRVFYLNSGGASHDELVAGKERFARARQQGDHLPFWALEWTGITAPTTLVVEALDQGCPFQGHLSPKSGPSADVTFGSEVLHYPQYVTIDDVRTASPTKEVFVNGQHEAANQPKAIARAFLAVKPKPHPAMDFFESFSPGSTPETFTPGTCVPRPDNPASCYASLRFQSSRWTVWGDGLQDKTFAFGQELGELWATYGDASGDTGANFSMSPRKKATIGAGTFLHVTMEVNTFTTRRRYPQIFISDQEAPLYLPNGKSLLVQTFDGWPNSYQLEICDHRDWGANNQCPAYDLRRIKNKGVDELAPNEEPGELASATQRVRFDVYASSERAYLFLAGKPYGCANLPVGRVPSGPVSVTFGDVLYHSSVDALFTTFHAQHQNLVTRRHFDNLGFSSNVPAPAWDESRFPCQAPIAL